MNRRSLQASGAIVAAAAMLLTMVMVAPASAGKPVKEISFCNGGFDAEEGIQYVRVALCRTTKTKTASVNVSTVDGTASSPGDFTALTNQTVTFARNQTRAYLDIEIKWEGPGDVESTEQFTVKLEPGTASSGWTITTGPTKQATVSIAQMDTPPPPTIYELVANPASIYLSWSMSPEFWNTYSYEPLYQLSYSMPQAQPPQPYTTLTYGLVYNYTLTTTPQTNYCFQVQAISPEGGWSWPSTEECVTTPTA